MSNEKMNTSLTLILTLT